MGTDDSIEAAADDSKQEKPQKPVVNLQKEQIAAGVEGFMALLKNRVDKEGEQQNSELFSDEPSRVFLQVSGIKLGADSDKCMVKARLPNPLFTKESDVLLVVKDLERGIKADH